METHTFSKLYTTYYKSSFLFVKSFVRDDMACEDLVSDSLIQLWETIKKETVQYPQALLLKILKNRALNYLKHLEVQETVHGVITTISNHDLYYRVSTLQACEPNELFSAEITAIVKKTLLSLPSQTRDIFEKSRYENLSVKEIAEEKKLTVKSIEYHITKATKALRIALKDYMPAFYFIFY